MTKVDFIEKIADRLDISRKEAKIVFESILDGMVRAIRKGEDIELRGFGTFTTRMRNARKGRNPLTGVGLNVPRKRIPVFRASAELRALVNNPDKSNQKQPA